MPQDEPIAPSATAEFLTRCSRQEQRFFYPCNAKHREPQPCTFSFRRGSGRGSATVRVEECSFEEGGTGWRVWPCALLLACWLASSEHVLGLSHGTTVLEVGCGLGLPGLTAAALGAADAVLSDCLPVLLGTLVRSARANADSATRTRVAMLDWDLEASPRAEAAAEADELQHEEYSTEQGVKAAQLAAVAADAESTACPRDTAWQQLGESERFGLLLASDVVYSMRHARQLPKVLAGRLRSGGRVAAMVPVRSEAHTRCFLCGLLAHGFRLLVSRVDRPWVEGVTAIQRGAAEPAADGDAEDAARCWTRHTAANGKPFWHNARSQQSVWTDPALAAAWREAATPFSADAPLREGEILFVDAVLPLAT